MGVNRSRTHTQIKHLPTGPKVAPKVAHRSRAVVAMTRKKTAQAPSVLATTSVLVALIVHERFRLIAMVVGMRIVVLNGTELARWTCTSTQSQLFSLLCSLALCIACIHPFCMPCTGRPGAEDKMALDGTSKIRGHPFAKVQCSFK